MRSLLLVLLLLAPSSLVFGQAESVPSENSSSRESRLTEFLKQIDTNHDGQIDTEEIQVAGPRAGMIEGLIRRAGLEPKYPIKISDIQAGMQNARKNGGQAVAESPKEPPKFKSLLEILEAMPRKPEKGDNVLASKMANQWLQTNVLGSIIQISGRLSSLDGNASGEGGSIQLSVDKQGLWEGHNFDLRAFAHASGNVNLNDFSKIVQCEMVTLEGRILNLEMRWDKGKGTIQLQLDGCKLVSVNKPEVTVGFSKTGGGTLTISDSNTYTGTTNVSGGTLVISGSNTYTGETEASKPIQEPTPAKTKINAGAITLNGGTLAVSNPRKFWAGTTDSGEYAVRLEEIHFVQLIEAKLNNPPTWLILILLKTKNDPIPVSFNDAEKAHAAYQSLLQALESDSARTIEGIGRNPEAGLRGTVRMQNAPVEKRKPPEEKKEKGLFD